jgi:hypothetical protein
MVMMNFGKMIWAYKTFSDRGEGLTATCISKVGPASPWFAAQRIRNEVIINNMKRIYIISADTVVDGFGDGKDGKTLRQLMIPNKIYNYYLEPVVPTPKVGDEVVSMRPAALSRLKEA